MKALSLEEAKALCEARKNQPSETSLRDLPASLPALPPVVTVAELLPIQKSDIIEAIKRCRGSLTAAADSLNLPDPALLLYWVKKDKEVRLAYETARMRLVDRSEQNVFNAVEDNDLATSKFVLRTLGKERGYTERYEIDARHQHIGSPQEATTEQLITLLQEALQMGSLNGAKIDYPLLEEDINELSREAAG